MNLSRIARQQESRRVLRLRLLHSAVLLALASVLTGLWLMHYLLAFTILSIIIFFGVLSLNPHNIRKLFPGLNCSNNLWQCAAVAGYVLAAIACISKFAIGD